MPFTSLLGFRIEWSAIFEIFMAVASPFGLWGISSLGLLYMLSELDRIWDICSLSQYLAHRYSSFSCLLSFCPPLTYSSDLADISNISSLSSFEATSCASFHAQHWISEVLGTCPLGEPSV